ncbi:MAG: zf-TFIIB domain-containing protein [Deltaproteobacteria bacterium]|nr:zf-TFIIB domain-containing protein [Deltaproteobacteria bacterium]
MPRCNSCSAPLPANSSLCGYCGTRNDMDFYGKPHYTIHQPESPRICPHCSIPLQTINLDLKPGSNFLIERCAACFGLFFDPGEVEALLESTVSQVFEINYQQIASTNRERSPDNQKFQYIRCPVCRALMNRVNFGHQSGVIVDHCKTHGLWLDNGEITHLLEWRKAGGQLLDQEMKKAKAAEKEKKVLLSKTKKERRGESEFAKVDDTDLLNTLSSAVIKLFS